MPPGRKTWMTAFAFATSFSPCAAWKPALAAPAASAPVACWARIRRKLGSVRPSPPIRPTCRNSRRPGPGMASSAARSESQPVAAPAHGLDLRTPDRSELAPQARGVHLHHVALAVDDAAPHPLEQLRPRDHASARLDQHP